MRAGSGATLREVLETTGVGTLAVWAAPADLDVRLTDVVVHDPAEGFAAGAGVVLLAVGVDPDGPAGVGAGRGGAAGRRRGARCGLGLQWVRAAWTICS